MGHNPQVKVEIHSNEVREKSGEGRSRDGGS